MILRRTLLKCGYNVLTAEDADAARAVVNKIGAETLDCVVTDYHMPGPTGLELLKWVKTRDPAVATVIVTAEGERALIAQFVRSGATDFLDKPVAPGPPSRRGGTGRAAVPPPAPTGAV